MPLVPKAVLLDIDGTIMTTGGAGRLALVRAANRLFGGGEAQARRELEAIDFRGNTDAVILSEFCRRLDVDPTEELPRLAAAYLGELDGALAECPCALRPGIAALVAILDSRPEIQCGVLTGNLKGGAQKKLAQVGLQHLVEGPGGFAEDGHLRPAIAAVAMERLAALGVVPTRTLVIGDTEHDVGAAHAVGARAVAVATGWTPLSDLARSGADLLLVDLADPSPVLELLEAL